MVTGAPKDELFVETKEWMKNLGLDYTKLSQVIASGPCPEVVKAIETGILRTNSHAISNAQKVQKFRILPHDFTTATGELGNHYIYYLFELELKKYFDFFQGQP